MGSTRGRGEDDELLIKQNIEGHEILPIMLQNSLGAHGD